VAFFNLYLLLAMGHFLGDFALQSDRMAQEKCAGADLTLPWWIWLTAHAAIHGLIVAVLTGIPLLGLGEWVLHSLIDYGKCRHRYPIVTDQLLHLSLKAVWAALAVMAVPS
jgi:hypothetical protein